MQVQTTVKSNDQVKSEHSYTGKMVFVIKATLRETTRRLTFDTTKFPLYSEIQTKLRTAFNLPSATQPFWVNVLYYPDDNQDARIMFKKHVCDATEYENAQAPFLHSPFPAPRLVLTVLLASDPRMNDIHSYHRARTLITSANDLAIHIEKLESDLEHKQTLLTALQDKLVSCSEGNDTIGTAFWQERSDEKQQEVNAIEGELFACQAEYVSITDQLTEDSVVMPGLSLRTYADTEEREDVVRTQQTHDELAAWKACNDVAAGPYDRMSFPPLDHILHSQPHGHGPHHRGRCSGGGHRGPRFHPHMPRPFLPPPPPFHRPWGAPAGRGSSPPRASAGAGTPPPPPSQQNDPFRSLMSRVTDVVDNPSTAVVQAQEIKSMLDGFLANLTNQLANTFDGAPRVVEPASTSAGPAATAPPAAPSTAQAVPAIAICPAMPGAFEQVPASTTTEAAAQTQPAAPVAASEKPRSPSSKLGKGGFRHKHISCDGCLQGIRGMRYKCEQCPDYDLCGSCLPLLHTSDLHPSHHTFQAMLHRGLDNRVKFSQDYGVSNDRHPATCDLCSQSIIGVRWKCLNCPDWDCCSSCSTSILDLHPGHSFVKISRPSDYVDPTGQTSRHGVRHPHIVCDGCDQSIRGTRYKCMHPDCPDYDLCENCEASPTTSHPRNHPMLKTKEPLKIDFQSTLEVQDRNGRPMRVHNMKRHQPQPQSQPKPPVSTPAPAQGFTPLPTAGLCAFQKHEIEVINSTGGNEWIRNARARNAGQRWQSCERHSTFHECETAKRAYLDSAAAADKAQPQDHLTSSKMEQDASRSLPNPIPPTPAIIKCYARPETIAQWKADEKEKKAKTPVSAMAEDEKPASGTRTPIKEPVTPLDIFSWVRHVTIAPGCTLPAGAEFTKSWKLKHFAHGHEYDFKTVRLIHMSDGLLGPGCKTDLVYTPADVKDGEEIEVSIKGLKVPDMPGEEVIEHWRFEDENGIPYGQPLRLRLTVESPASMHSSLSHSSVIMPTPNRDPSPSPAPAPIYQSREAEGLEHEHETASQAPTLTSVPTTPSLSLHDAEDDVISLHSSEDEDDDDDFALVDARSNVTAPSTHVADEEDQLVREEFDFADESEEGDRA